MIFAAPRWAYDGEGHPPSDFEFLYCTKPNNMIMWTQNSQNIRSISGNFS